VFAATAAGASVMTSAGLAEDERNRIIHQAFAESGAVQCGFCTPGMVMATFWLLSRNPDPSPDEIADGLVGNLCRCTGYTAILEAVRLASVRMRANG
jgi:carbon-monoxide dehydrogenase small subunit